MTDEKAKQDMNRMKMEEKARKRDQIVKVSGKRDAARSNKPQLNNKKEEKPIIDQDEVDLQNYLGLSLLNPNQGQQ